MRGEPEAYSFYLLVLPPCIFLTPLSAGTAPHPPTRMMKQVLNGTKCRIFGIINILNLGCIKVEGIIISGIISRCPHSVVPPGIFLVLKKN
jgi:hypothetical protein